MQVRFDHAEPQTATITSFYFRTEKPVAYEAGQFIQLRIPHDRPDKRGDKRWFTLSSSPTEDLLAITTKFAPENGSSFKSSLRQLAPGTVVAMAEPMGDFVLPKDENIPLVFVGGGIGVTTYRSMIKSLLDHGEQRQIQLLYALSSPQDVVFTDVFGSSACDLQIIATKPDDGWTGLTGQLTAERILELAGDCEGKLIYLSGPEPMIEQFEKDLKKLGINKRQLITDFFPGYVEI